MVYHGGSNYFSGEAARWPTLAALLFFFVSLADEGKVERRTEIFFLVCQLRMRSSLFIVSMHTHNLRMAMLHLHTLYLWVRVHTTRKGEKKEIIKKNVGKRWK